MQLISLIGFLSFILSVNKQRHACAFAALSKNFHSVTVISTSHDTLTALYVNTEDEHGDFFDVEAARRKFEILLTGAVAGGGSLDQLLLASRSHGGGIKSLPPQLGPSSSNQATPVPTLPDWPPLDVALPPRPALTTIERERRVLEIQLISKLSESDDALSDIWNLWFSERGPTAAALLRRADDLMEVEEDWEEAEVILKKLVDEYGVYFSEPINRLATLYYLQGKHEEALALNQLVLAVKPWHFGALSHIVMTYAALGDNTKAREWAAFRLPPSSQRRRSRWVEKVVTDALSLLHLREKTLSESFGEPDQQWIKNQFGCSPDAWQ